MENIILHGDCIELMKKIPDKHVQMVFADFPYETTKAKWDKMVDLNSFWEQANRLLKPNGVVICTAQFPFTYILAASNVSALRYDWVWEKTNATGHLNAKKMPMKAHENVLVFYNSLPIYNPQKTTGHERKVSTSEHKRNCIKTELYGNHGLTGYDSTERFPRSVLKISSDKQKINIHPTQKPVSLIKYFIETYTNKGDVVLDPVAGSGTTGVACEETGRRYILIEKEEKYYLNIIKRINPTLTP